MLQHGWLFAIKPFAYNENIMYWQAPSRFYWCSW
jgi:hypothetical protein